MEKICFKCKVLKPLSEFYIHKQMGDGHLNKCKDCTKKDTQERADKLMNNSEWVASEKKRNRLKSRRLPRKKYTNEEKNNSLKMYREKYPEKYFATIRVNRDNLKEGYHYHHWSYNPEHCNDCIELLMKDHYKVHRFIVYDQERFMYRKNKNMELLDTKERHNIYIQEILENEED